MGEGTSQQFLVAAWLAGRRLFSLIGGTKGHEIPGRSMTVVWCGFLPQPKGSNVLTRDIPHDARYIFLGDQYILFKYRRMMHGEGLIRIDAEILKVQFA